MKGAYLAFLIAAGLELSGIAVAGPMSCVAVPGNPALGISDRVHIIEGTNETDSCSIQGVALPAGNTPVDIFELNPLNPLLPVSDQLTITPVAGTNTAVVTVVSDATSGFAPRSTAIAAIEPTEGMLGGVANQTTPFGLNHGFLVNGTLYEFISDPAAEVNEEHRGPNGGIANSFNIVFPGQFTKEDFFGKGLISQPPPNLNPFAAGGCTTNVGYSVTFNASANTSTLSIFCTDSSGNNDNADHPIPPQNNPGANSQDHFQYSAQTAGPQASGEVTTAPGAIAEFWSSVANGQTPVPVANFFDAASGGNCGSLVFAIASYQVTVGGNVGRQWTETPVCAGGSGIITISNPGLVPETISLLTLALSDTEIDIALLNQNTDPVGTFGTLLIGASGVTLAPGQSITITPEPDAILLLGAGILCLLAKKSRAANPDRAA